MLNKKKKCVYVLFKKKLELLLKKNQTNKKKKMADITAAFGLPFQNTCALKFDVAPLFENEKSNTLEWIGVVSMNSFSGTIMSFTYEIYSAGNMEQFSGCDKTCFVRGTVENSNNLMFSFRIHDPKVDYFVLVKPKYKDEIAPQRPKRVEESTDIKMCDLRSVVTKNDSTVELPNCLSDQKFGIFYTSKLIKKRTKQIKSCKQKTDYKSVDVITPITKIVDMHPDMSFKAWENPIKKEEYFGFKPLDVKSYSFGHNKEDIVGFQFETPNFTEWPSPNEFKLHIKEKNQCDKDFETFLHQTTTIKSTPDFTQSPRQFRLQEDSQNSQIHHCNDC